jgi:hypothetical protein
MAIIFFKKIVLPIKVQLTVHKFTAHIHTLNGSRIGQNVDLMWSQSNCNHVVTMQL